MCFTAHKLAMPPSPEGERKGKDGGRKGKQRTGRCDGAGENGGIEERRTGIGGRGGEERRRGEIMKELREEDQGQEG